MENLIDKLPGVEGWAEVIDKLVQSCVHLTVCFGKRLALT